MIAKTWNYRFKNSCGIISSFLIQWDTCNDDSLQFPQIPYFFGQILSQNSMDSLRIHEHPLYVNYFLPAEGQLFYGVYNPFSWVYCWKYVVFSSFVSGRSNSVHCDWAFKGFVFKPIFIILLNYKNGKIYKIIEFTLSFGLFS